MENPQLASSNADPNSTDQDDSNGFFVPRCEPSNEHDLGYRAEPGPTTDFGTNWEQGRELTNNGFQTHNIASVDQEFFNWTFSGPSQNPISSSSDDVDLPPLAALGREFPQDPPNSTPFHGGAPAVSPLAFLAAPISDPQTPANPQRPALDNPPEHSTHAPSGNKRRKSSNIYSCVAVMEWSGNNPILECQFKDPNFKKMGQHMQKMHGVKAFKCPYCGHTSARYDNLNTHISGCKMRATAGETTPPIPTPTNKRPARRRQTASDLPMVRSGFQSQSLTVPFEPNYLPPNIPSLPQSRRPMSQPQPEHSVFRELNADNHHSGGVQEWAEGIWPAETKAEKIKALKNEFTAISKTRADGEKRQIEIALEIAYLS
ncbi:hypothetical protein TWF730_010029 [Orbilia blumenaviensis]|uniref:C2H2-type domain-containing protein n=1 Tax=Orbilia blumenaviensis TaxID=1796055 RepID=A0AAV9UVZ8_9PEZI